MMLVYSTMRAIWSLLFAFIAEVKTAIRLFLTCFHLRQDGIESVFFFFFVAPDVLPDSCRRFAYTTRRK